MEGNELPTIGVPCPMTIVNKPKAFVDIPVNVSVYTGVPEPSRISALIPFNG
jgi:hypothetical protein